MKIKPHAGVAGVAYIEPTHSLQLEGAYDVGGHLLRVRQRHAHHAVRLRAARRPVLKSRAVLVLLRAVYTSSKIKTDVCCLGVDAMVTIFWDFRQFSEIFDNFL
jgi:hypothetical protein